MRAIHLEAEDGRDTRVAFAAVRAPSGARLGRPGLAISFRRYVSSAESGLHENLVRRFGADYSQALVDGDPEIDLEVIGRPVDDTTVVWLSADGDVLHAPPEIVEVVIGPDGQERERRPPADTPANVNEELPVRVTPRRIKRSDAVRQYVFSRTVQVRHVDGLTFDHLRALAQRLDEADEVVLVGGGVRGRDPLVFSTNGSPWRGFLEGRVDGNRYLLLLHLSNQELKRP
jgi:hypothetical protein